LRSSSRSFACSTQSERAFGHTHYRRACRLISVSRSALPRLFGAT
jgi:hypothetical protein